MALLKKIREAFIPKKDVRIITLGLDAAGKTTFIYKLKLGEIVTTVPTIGFSLETVDYKNLHFSLWDVGGCSKIGPLIRHFLKGINALIWVLDANDPDRFGDSLSEMKWILSQEEVEKDIPVLVYCNKQDLPNVVPLREIKEKFSEIMNTDSYRFKWRFQPSSATFGDGLFEGLDWLSNIVEGKETVEPAKITESRKGNQEETKKVDLAPNKAPNLDVSMSSSNALPPSNENPFPKKVANIIPPSPTTVPSSPSDSLSDDEFIKSLEDCSLPYWDHKTHLRIAWLYLERFGRREGIKKIRGSIQNYIANSGRTNKTWHETMTYFWIQMVDYARLQMKEDEKGDFEVLLRKNIHLMNGSLFLQYYSKELILLNQDARKEFVLPDINPLPSIQ